MRARVSAQSSTVRVAGQGVERVAQAVQELGHAAGEVDVAAVDVVEREGAAEEPLALLGHGDAEQDPVEAGLPGVGAESSSWNGARCAASKPQRTHAPLTHSSSRNRSSSPKWKRRRTGSRPARSSTSVAVILAVASSRTSARTPMHRVGLPERPVGQADLEGARRVVGAVAEVVAAERRLDQRREVLDVGAHHDDVAGLEGRVLLEQVQDGVAQHLDLTARPWQECTRMLSSAASSSGPASSPPLPGARRRPVEPDVVLDAAAAASWPPAACRRARVVVAVRTAAPSTSCISRASRPHDASSGLRAAPAVGSSARASEPRRRADRGRETVPQRRRRVEQEEVHVAPGGHRLEDVEVAGRQAGSGRRARGAGGRSSSVGLVPQTLRRLRPAARPGSAARCARAAGARARTCQAASSVGDRPGGPALQHVGPVHGVAVEEVGHVADAREALRASHRLRVADVLGQRRQPRLVEVLVHHLHATARPHARATRVGVGVGTRGQRQRAGDQACRGRGSRCWRTPRRARPGAHRGAPTAAGSASARSPGSGPRRPRAPSGRRAARPPGRPASRPGRRRDRSGGRAAPRQSTSPVFSVAAVPSARVRRWRCQAGCRCWRRPRAAPRSSDSSASLSSSSSTACRWRGAASIGESSAISGDSPPTTPRPGNLRAETRTRVSSEPTALL